MDGLDPVKSQAHPNAIGVVAFVEGGKLEDVLRGKALIEGLELAAIVGFAGRYMEGDGAVFVEGGRVDLGGEAASRAAKSLVVTVFFGAPAACGWARTVVESTNTPRASAKGSA